jgi:predicted DNA-binding protein
MAAPPGLRKKPLTTYLEHEQWKRLSALSRRTHVPMNWYIREGINLILEQFGGNPGTPP